MVGKTKPLILIVGACNPIADSLAIALREQGEFKAVFADGLDDSVTASLFGGIDVILLDCDQRGINGCESVKRLAVQFPASKIVITSAGLTKTDALAALRAGARGYLPKQTPVTTMVQTLIHILNGEIYLPATFGRIPGRPAVRRSAKSAAHFELDAEVLQSIQRGMSNREIAESLEIPEAKLKRVIRVLFRQLEVSSQCECAPIAQPM